MRYEAVDRPAVVMIILQVLTELRANPDGMPYSEQTQLLGQSQVLDSLGLVTVITEVEEQVNERWSSSIVLTSESALSRQWSPFHTVGSSLADFVVRADGSR